MIPLWAISAIGAAAVAGTAGYGLASRLADAKLARAQAGWSQERADAANAAASASELYRAQEQAWAASAAKIQSEGEARNAQILKRAADLDRTVGGLRSKLNATVAALRDSAASSPAIAINCADPIDSVGVLSDMLTGLAERGGKVAALADQAISASKACVAAYDLAR